MDYIQLLRKEKKNEKELTECCSRYKASKRSNIGNEPRSWFGSASASVFFFSSSSYVFSFVPNLMNPLKPFPRMAIYRKSNFGQWQLALASWFLKAEGPSSPRRASCLGLKAFGGSGKPDVSRGELGSRKIHKMTLLSLSFSFLFSWPRLFCLVLEFIIKFSIRVLQKYRIKKNCTPPNLKCTQ